MKRKSWKLMSQNERKKEMKGHWARIAKVHANIECGNWIAHQIVRFVYEGYASATQPLLRQLQSLEPNAERTSALQLLLDAEKKRPTPFAGLIPFGQLYRDA